MKIKKELVRILFIVALVLPILYLSLASGLNNKIEKVRDEIGIRTQSIREMQELIAGMPTIEHSIDFQSFGQIDASLSGLLNGGGPVKEFFILNDDLNVLHSVSSDYNDITGIKSEVFNKWDKKSQYLFWDDNLFIFKKATKGYVVFRLSIGDYFNERMKKQNGLGISYKNQSPALNSNSIQIAVSKSPSSTMRYFFSFINENGGIFLLIILLSILAVELSFRVLINPFRKLVFFLQNLSSSEIKNVNVDHFPRLFRPYIKNLIDANSTIRSAIQREKEIEIEKGQYKLAQQVAHDIRSPLGVLKSLRTELTSKREEDRRIFQSCLNRIEEIALNLIRTTKDSSGEDERRTEDLLTVLESVLTEKRAEFRNNDDVEIEGHFDSSSYGLHSEIKSSFLKRVLSNVINNSVEASPNKNIHIQVRLFKKENFNSIEIRDNGPGIAPEYLDHVFTKGFTTKASGNGLGLSGAKEVIEGMGGEIELTSILGEGVTIKIRLPESSTTSGLAKKIDFYRYAKVIVLDDDFSIHGVWDKKLKDLGKPVEHFYSPSDFIKKYPRLNENVLLLSDFEFLNEKMDGIDVINHYNHSLHSILITARSEEREIRKRCQEGNIHFISKTLISYVPINMNAPEIILIDDDKLSHWRWERHQEIAKFNFKGFFSIENFLSESQVINKEVCILLDSDLGEGVRGEIEGEKIFNLGFKNIYLYTSYEELSFDRPFWIKRVISKDPATVLSVL